MLPDCKNLLMFAYFVLVLTLFCSFFGAFFVFISERSATTSGACASSFCGFASSLSALAASLSCCGGFGALSKLSSLLCSPETFSSYSDSVSDCGPSGSLILSSIVFSDISETLTCVVIRDLLSSSITLIPCDPMI